MNISKGGYRTNFLQILKHALFHLAAYFKKIIYNT